jgi:hypothetical protein
MIGLILSLAKQPTAATWSRRCFIEMGAPRPNGVYLLLYFGGSSLEISCNMINWDTDGKQVG